ncbi:cell wall-binding repeat-containing protein [Mesobacillus sp. AQ2]|uniref:cell wall-binding repeat-containing protein n=1 Tax=Bacillaceae TaxID=186817 RepID=UPI0011A935DD|nr:MULTISPECIES: cell wall-binding repeat-containing protein [Bacillaceae]WHX40248.1 cell wall-binding repeat-containing protein [Mesobacillus sp. AQ2]
MKKVFVAFLFAAAFCFIAVLPASAEGYTIRLGGQDRFEVAVNVSKKGWTSANTVILANYDAYADALAAAPLAYKYNAPILLTQPGVLTAATKAEIDRLNATNVIAVGGSASISDSVLSEVRKMGLKTERISGANRFEVANNIALRVGKSSKVVLAYGLNFPDALAIAPYAARNGYPILLTNTNTLPGSTKAIIDQWGVSQTIIVGGEGSISRNVYNSVPNPYRIDGRNRFEVAANIANKYFSTRSQSSIATGMTFADALTGAVFAAKRNEPILLTTATSVPTETRSAIINNGYQSFFVYGGPGSVSEGIFNSLAISVVGKTIMIDAGHGGTDPGASGYTSGGTKLVEKDLVLDMSKRIQSRLTSSMSKVLMTRTGDTYPTLNERVAKANSSGADIFVSMHVNSYSTSSPHGTETWWNSTYESADSQLLAEEIQKELIATLGTYNRGVKHGDFRVIKDTKIPSVLVEVAFVSNKDDADLLANSTFRQKAADAVYRGIINYFNKQ